MLIFNNLQKIIYLLRGNFQQIRCSIVVKQMGMESTVNRRFKKKRKKLGVWGREIRKMDGEIWKEKRRKSYDGMKFSFIDAVSVNYNAYMQNTVAPTTMAGPCTPHGRWSHSKRYPVWGACHGATPSRRFKDVCKRDLKLTDINTGSWESLAEDRSGWRQAVQAGVRRGEEKRNKQMGGNRDRIPTQRPHTSATTVAKTVMPGLDS